ncbi:Rho GTPase-activating protein [Quillaja saponaria]|uniref:Rho GTPase-activating protein n=1 Tax=Quillaja saponaria TaxID=32244 RepID=A0AAD7Q7A4_QUISA|nr:Rho GTPase-activating protein [Quillaja saponaria]KAJ7976140.1 Rho GTPase-activating protein [Quillaja saponaria]
MTEVLQSPSYFSSTSSSSSPCAPPTSNDASHPDVLNNSLTIGVEVEDHSSSEGFEEEREGEGVGDRKRKERDREGDQLSLWAFLITAFRKSSMGCSTGGEELSSMEIGWPSNARHVAHVTFDRFNGFLGLPVEFEPDVPRRAPSASTTVFGVSTESMQLSFDARGNSVPVILLLMQKHLYAQGGLQAEGIFRINAENSQEEYVREQLNRGVIPDGVDVHCLAGLIKAWFRELPTGVLDSLSSEQVMQSKSEEECAQLVRLLPPIEAALLDWAINLMADVAQLEHLNKMNARNVAMVFAPNMTQMEDPLTALMYAVQVMNFLKTLVVKLLREREDSMVESTQVSNLEPFRDDEDRSSSQLIVEEGDNEAYNESDEEKAYDAEKPAGLESATYPSEDGCETESGSPSFLTSIENIIPGGQRLLVDKCPCDVASQVCSLTNRIQEGSFKGEQIDICKRKTSRSSCSNVRKDSKMVNELPTILTRGPAMVSHINSRTELFEAWR